MPRTTRVTVGSIPNLNRDDLVPGQDWFLTEADAAANTGPAASSFEDIYPAAGQHEMTLAAQTYTGKRFWCCIKGVAGTVVDDCIVAGPDPLTFGAAPDGDGSPAQKGGIQNFGTTPPKWTVKNTRVDGSEWLQAYAPGGARSKLNPHGFGYHGCNTELRFVEIVNCGDGANLVGPNGNDPPAVLSQSTLFWYPWFHKGYYQNDVRAISDGQNHADGIQTNTGRNYTVQGGRIGGDRDPIGYNTWPGWAPSNGPGYNGGDDFCYSALQLTQEVDLSDTNRLENLLFEYIVLGGGTATISHPFDLSYNYATTTIRHNRFLRRLTDWGKTLSANAAGGWVPFQRNTGVGSAISRQGGVTSTYTDNVWIDDLTGVPGGEL